MAIHHLTLGDLLASAGPLGGTAADDVALIDLDAGARPGVAPHPIQADAPGIVVGLTADARPHEHPGAPACDAVLPHGDPARLDQLLATVAGAPLAARAFVVHMRAAPRPLEAGLDAESAVYSSLQAGPEFAAWRAGRPVRQREPLGEPVRLERAGPTLTITLHRPEVRNALNTAMRDALVEAFALPALDPSIEAVHLRGVGESFCSGGDLDEFGTFPDRVTAHLHGACAGSGIELPAFAGRVLAAPSTRLSLPELALGLIPGAGGTVSITRRVGRHRTTRLGLTGESLDAATALDWGLIDAIGSVGSGP